MLSWQRLINKSKDLISDIQGKYRHFSFMIYKNEILSCGTNCPTKTVRLAFDWNYLFPFRHSELDCIAKCNLPPSLFKKCRLINIRIGHKDNILLSRPCKDCQRVILAFNIGEVYYSNEWGNFEKLKF